MHTRMQKINLSTLSALHTSLHYLYVDELRTLCERLGLSSKGKKLLLISRIMHFLTTGQKLSMLAYPPQSVGRSMQFVVPGPQVVMLKNRYKNDLENRNFFKKIIGQHFHFTAFGIDWLEDRWMAGNPPTYQEFADMWQQEYERRKQEGSIAKVEWAYINCVQRYLVEHPTASREEILAHWMAERNAHKTMIKKFFALHLQMDVL